MRTLVAPEKLVLLWNLGDLVIQKADKGQRSMLWKLSLILCSSSLTWKSVTPRLFCFTDLRSLICPSSKKIKLIGKYWKIVLLLIYLIDKQPSCEQWQEIWSSFCTKTGMALCLECQPKYTTVMRSFWRSNGRTWIFFSSQPLFQLNLEFCNTILSLASNVHSCSAP